MTAFYRKRSSLDGRQSYCKACDKRATSSRARLTYDTSADGFFDNGPTLADCRRHDKRADAVNRAAFDALAANRKEAQQ